MVPFVFTWVVSFQAKIMYFQAQNLLLGLPLWFLCIYLRSVILGKNNLFLATKSFVGIAFMVPFVFTWVVSFQGKMIYFQAQNLVGIAFMVPFVFTWVVLFQAKIMYFYGQNLLFGLPYVHCNSPATAATTTFQFQVVKSMTSFYTIFQALLVKNNTDQYFQNQ